MCLNFLSSGLDNPSRPEFVLFFNLNTKLYIHAVTFSFHSMDVESHIFARLVRGSQMSMFQTLFSFDQELNFVHGWHLCCLLIVCLYNRRPVDELSPEERDARTVFCMQLSQRIRARDLEEFFSSVGKVHIFIIYPDSNLLALK